MDSFLKTTNKYFYDNGPVLVSELNKLLKTYLSSMISSIQANEDQSIYDEYAREAVAQPTITPPTALHTLTDPGTSMMTVPKISTTLRGGSKRSTRKLDMKKRR